MRYATLILGFAILLASIAVSRADVYKATPWGLYNVTRMQPGFAPSYDPYARTRAEQFICCGPTPPAAFVPVPSPYPPGFVFVPVPPPREFRR
jgi:hypothetical protein